MKAGGGSRKGAAFERSLCAQLSLWWTGGDPLADLFWRSSQSGGRATTRQKKGLNASNHCGDITALHPLGSVLTDVMTLECKAGYPRASLGNLLDLPMTSAQQPYEEWYQQAEEASARAKSFSWLIIHKRNKCEPVVTMPWRLLERLRTAGALKTTPVPFMAFSTQLRVKTDGKSRLIVAKLASMHLKHFLHGVKPVHVRAVWKTI